MSKAVCVVVPVYRTPELSRAVVADLARESDLVDVCLVDNGGDWDGPGPARVLRPGANLGWAGGCDAGIAYGLAAGYEAFCLMNSDVRLSPGYCAGLLDELRTTGAQVVAGVYDDPSWPHQYRAGLGAAGAYQPVGASVEAPFVDGTCLMISAATVREVGLLDHYAFPRHGWGPDLDYALRVRRAGGSLRITESAYLNHALGGSTPDRDHDWTMSAFEEMCLGMRAKWGTEWEEELWRGFEPVKHIEREYATYAALRDGER